MRRGDDMADIARDSVIADRILRAAIRLFAHKGYSGTSTREIAEAAGITKPMLYYYFKSKEGLCQAAMDDYLVDIQRRLDPVPAMNLSPEEELVEIVWAGFEFASERPDFARLVIMLAYGPQGEVPGLNLTKFAENVRKYLVNAAERACRAGVARPGSGDAFAQALNGLAFVWVLESVGSRKLALTRALAEEMVHDLLNGFGPRSADDYAAP
jgi:AcrR family transcriptional regulator